MPVELRDNPAGQYNPALAEIRNLVAETGELRPLEVVYTPNWLEGLSVAVDWFDIEVTDAIGSIPAKQV